VRTSGQCLFATKVMDVAAMRSVWRAVFFVTMAALPWHAHAWGSLLLPDAPPHEDTLALGVTHWRLPSSPESNSMRSLWSPAFEYRRADGGFVSTEMGLGWDLSRKPDWQYGPRLWPVLGRPHRDPVSGQAPMGDRWQKQWFANHMVDDVVLLQSAFSWGSGRNQAGFQSEFGAASGVPLWGGMLGFGLATTFGNAAYRHDDAGSAHRSWSDASLTLGYELRWSGHWHVDGQVQRARIMGSPASGQSTQGAALLTLWRDW
jgi:hypothetical protein